MWIHTKNQLKSMKNASDRREVLEFVTDQDLKKVAVGDWVLVRFTLDMQYCAQVAEVHPDGKSLCVFWGVDAESKLLVSDDWGTKNLCIATSFDNDSMMSPECLKIVTENGMELR